MCTISSLSLGSLFLCILCVQLQGSTRMCGVKKMTSPGVSHVVVCSEVSICLFGSHSGFALNLVSPIDYLPTSLTKTL